MSTPNPGMVAEPAFKTKKRKNIVTNEILECTPRSRRLRESKIARQSYYAADGASFGCLFDCVSMYNADTRFLSPKRTTEANEGLQPRFRTPVLTSK